MTIQELRQERAKLIAQANDLVGKVDAEKRSLNPEENQTWEQLQTHIDKLEGEIDIAEKRERVRFLTDDLKKTSSKTGPTPISQTRDSKSQNNAFRGWLKANTRGKNLPLTPEERSACELHGVTPYQDTLSVASTRYQLSNYFPEQRSALAEGSWTISGSGNASPLFTYMNISDLIDTALKQYGSLMNRATIIETPNAWPLPIPTVNDTTVSGVWTSEGSAITPTNLGATASVVLNAYKLATSVTYSWELLQDALFPLEAYLAQQLGGRMARAAELAFASGSGSGQPTGLFSSATTYETAGGTTTNVSLTFDDIIGLQQSIDPLYLDQGCELEMHQSTYAYLLKLKTTIGSYLLSEGGFSSSQFEDNVARFRGMPIRINNSMTAINTTSGAPIIGCGLTSKYFIRKVSDIQLQVNPYINALNAQTTLIAWARFDGQLIDAGTHPYKVILNP